MISGPTCKIWRKWRATSIMRTSEVRSWAVLTPAWIRARVSPRVRTCKLQVLIMQQLQVASTNNATTACPGHNLLSLLSPCPRSSLPPFLTLLSLEAGLVRVRVMTCECPPGIGIDVRSHLQDFHFLSVVFYFSPLSLCLTLTDHGTQVACLSCLSVLYFSACPSPSARSGTPLPLPLLLSLYLISLLLFSNSFQHSQVTGRACLI